EIAEMPPRAHFEDNEDYGTGAEGPKQPYAGATSSLLKPASGQREPIAEIAKIAENPTVTYSEDNGDFGTDGFPIDDPLDPDDLEERAAIIAEGSGCPVEWAEGLALLDPNRPPGDVPQDYWMAFCDTAGAFADRWAAKAAALGWTVEEVFGCDRHAPFARLDRRGLVWSLVGCSLVDLTKTEAVIEMPSGNRLKHRRRGSDSEPARAALAWDPL